MHPRIPARLPGLLSLLLMGACAAGTGRALPTSHPAHPGAKAGMRLDTSQALSDAPLMEDEPDAEAAHGGHAHHGAPPGSPAPALFTCPMHPDVTATAPGECPRCGMTLEPSADPSLESAPPMDHSGHGAHP